MGRVYIYEGMGLTPEQIQRLDALDGIKDEDIVYDEDSPKLTKEQLEKFKRVRRGKEAIMSKYPQYDFRVS
ncbi:MAG: hypothetical protein IKN12_13090 [Selenomonadaceae bacterium]|nr:hypothetical protein [Selenomonadaceae bacterium]MBR3723676.1 hypothetical protein [Selenomonadaceae bacterium]